MALGMVNALVRSVLGQETNVRFITINESRTGVLIHYAYRRPVSPHFSIIYSDGKVSLHCVACDEAKRPS